MSTDTPASQPPDRRLSEQISRELEKQLPRLMKVERFLSAPVVIWTILSALGLLSLGSWGAKIVWNELEKNQINTTTKEVQTSIGKGLNQYFGTQVDSANFKVLRFGCSTKEASHAADFPLCANFGQPDQQFNLVEDQTIQFIANLQLQKVQLDVSLYPIDISAMDDLSLEIYLEPTSVRPTSKPGRKKLEIRPSDVAGEVSVQDGRVLLTNGALLTATIDLSRLIDRGEGDKSGKAHVLRFRAVRSKQGVISPATGTERFYLRTIIFTYHRLSDGQAADAKSK